MLESTAANAGRQLRRRSNMRILGFSKEWPKLSQAQFTTFRLARKDRDWAVGETVQIVIRPRSKAREIRGVAKIIAKEPRIMGWRFPPLPFPRVTEEEALEDGFEAGEEFSSYAAFGKFLWASHDHKRLMREPINRLVLRWRI